MTTQVSQSPNPNFVYRNGTLWFPLVNSVTGQTTLPIYTGGDFGSIMPFIKVRIPGIFDSAIIPYENIVEFEYVACSTDSNAVGSATLQFLDQTPIFVEEILRRAINKQGISSEPTIKVEYGWRMQNPPRSLAPLLSEDGLLTSGEIDFSLIMGSYKYTNFGVMATLELQRASMFTAYGYTLDIGELDTKKLISSKSDFENHLSDVINNNVKSGDKFRVSLLSDTIRTNNLAELKITGTVSVQDLLQQVLETLYIPTKDKSTPYGRPFLFLGETKIVQRDSAGNQTAFYPVYFYDKDRLPDFAYNVPIFQYPANESPILSWSPTLSKAADYSFLFDNVYKYVSKDGNEKQETARTKAVIAGVDSVPQEQGSNKPIVAANKNILGAGRQQHALATIDVDIIGDPLFSTINTQFTRIRVDNADIIQEGVLRDRTNFFSNFPGLLEPTKSLLPIISGLPGGASPFNGGYVISDVKHKISASRSYQTSISLLWQLDSIIT